MSKSSMLFVSLAVAHLLTAPTARGDLSYNLKSQSTGAMAPMMAQFLPPDAHVTIHGNQMVMTSHAGVSIWDVERATFTEIDTQKKTYSVTSFSEMTSGIRRLLQLQFRQAGIDTDQLTTKIDVCTSETGNVRKMKGVESREVHILVRMDIRIEKISSSISIVAEGQVWLGPEQAGYSEQVSFNKTKWEQLGWDKDPKSRGFDVFYMLAVVEKEIDGLRGTPTSQNIQLRAALLSPTSAKNETKGNLLIELSSDYDGFSNAPIDPSKFEIPNDFQKVQNELLRQLPD